MGEKEELSNPIWLIMALFLVILTVLCVCFDIKPLTANAAETAETYNYTSTIVYTADDGSIWTSIYNIQSAYPIFSVYYYDDGDVRDYACTYRYLGNSKYEDANSNNTSIYLSYYKNGVPLYEKYLLDSNRGFSFNLLDSQYTNDYGMPVFSSFESAIAYFETGDDSGQINKPYDGLTDSIPSFDGFDGFTFDATDSSFLSDFKLENFTADYKVNASWTGVHIPTKLNDWVTNGTVSVDDIGVCVMFTYANKTYASDTYVKYLPTLINVTDLSTFIDVSQYQPTDSNYYLASLSFVPLVEFTYYNSGMGVTMIPLNLMYYGSMSHIYFNSDGSPNGSDFNNGDINGDTDGGFAAGSDDYDGLGGITGDISDAADAVKDIFNSVTTGIKVFTDFLSYCFSWMPWWVTAILGTGVFACVIIGICKAII